MAIYLGPNITATNPEVGGTVESHNNPITLEKTKTEIGDIGNRDKQCNHNRTHLNIAMKVKLPLNNDQKYTLKSMNQ